VGVVCKRVEAFRIKAGKIPEIARDHNQPVLDCFVVRITLWKHRELRARFQNPEYRIQYFSGGNRLATCTAFRNIFFREMLLDTAQVFVLNLHYPPILWVFFANLNFWEGF